MDGTTKKILKLLFDERMERRCAAAIVLGELGAKEPAVIDALGRCLAEENRLLQGYVLEALMGVRSPKLTRLLLPLLDHGDEEIRARVSALLAAQGSRTLSALAGELESAPVARRRAIVGILSRHRDRETLEKLLDMLPDAEIGEYVLNSLRGEMEHLSSEETETLHELVSRRLKEKKRVASDPGGTARALRLLGHWRNPRLVRAILPFVGESRPLPVRVAAVAALRRPLGAANGAGDAVRALLACADDADPALARAAVDTLRSVPFPAEAADELVRLTESRHVETRTFAVEALARAEAQRGAASAGEGNRASAKTIHTLIAQLRADDPGSREAAVRALARLDGAASGLLHALSEATDTASAQLLCRLLRGHAERLKPGERKAVAALALGALEAGEARAEPLLDLLAAVDRPGFRDALLARAASHRRGKRYDEAFAVLGRLESAGLLDDDGRYAAAVAGLCALASKKDLGRASRTTDPILRQFVELIDRGYPLASKLRKESGLTDDDLFFVGFNFSESKDEDEKEFGGALLGHLAETSPRSKLGRSAKNKLKLVGLEA